MFHYAVPLAHRGEYGTSGQEGKAVFVGVVLHRSRWQVTVRTEDQDSSAARCRHTGRPYGAYWIGIGLIAAMELSVELQDVSRFRRAEQLAAER